MRQRLFATLILFLFPVAAHAQWIQNGTPISTNAAHQMGAHAAPDGTGGAIVAWQDDRNGSVNDIYIQRVNGSGVVKWTTDGLPLCTAANSQETPAICSDGAGGAIVAWSDRRNGTDWNIYAQRINSTGVTQWLPASGVAVCTASGDQTEPDIVSDNAHGAIIAWTDGRNGAVDIYAQRLSDQGVRQATLDGAAVCTAANTQSAPFIATDGEEGAIIAWLDQRTGFIDIYAQRMMPNGFMQWTAGGVGICVLPRNEFPSGIAADGAGGAVIVWADQRNLAFTATDIYAQRVDPFGTVLWTTDGVAVCTRNGHQNLPVVACDNTGNSIVAWNDAALGDIYAQRVSPLGAPMWAANGTPVCAASNDQLMTTIVTDGAGGAVLAWTDNRVGPAGEYAQHVDASGVGQWASNGVLVSTPGAQSTSDIVSDGAGGAVIVWHDIRSANDDIYALRLASNGSRPTGVGATPFIPETTLSPNFPAPFSKSTSMYLSLRHDSNVSVDVFDVAGRRVRVMAIGPRRAGTWPLAFDGRDDRGGLLPSGVYFYRVHAGGESVTNKMVIAR